MHHSVMLEEVLSFFEGRQLPTFLDGTLGAGGHAAALLEAHPEMSLIGIDRDPMAREIAGERLKPFGERVEIRDSNFCEGLEPADGMLLDLGLSSMQLADKKRGFSFAEDGPLDMRMDPTGGMTAAQLLQRPELERWLAEYGELRRPRALARAIREARPATTAQLLEAIPLRHPRGRAKLFQALRIAVNDELRALQMALPKAIELLKPGGRLVVISFHSLEDRLVKMAFRAASAQILTPKPLTPSLEEVRRNRRARSAKLRAIEK